MANLLPVVKKQEITKHYRVRVFALFVLMLVLNGIIALALLAPSYYIAWVNVKRASVAPLTVSGNEKDLFNNAKKIIHDARSNMDILRGGDGMPRMTVNIIDVVLKHKTRDIAVTMLSYVRIASGADVYGRVVVGGRAKDRESLASFEESLRNDPSVVNVVNPVSNFVKKKDVDFQITLQVRKAKKQ